MKTKLISLCGWEETIADPGRSEQPGNRAELLRTQKLLRLAIEQELTARQRECVRLYFFDRLTEEQIGRRPGVGKSTVCRHLQKAKLRLKRALSYAATTRRDGQDDE